VAAIPALFDFAKGQPTHVSIANPAQNELNSTTPAPDYLFAESSRPDH
jgi:hypothetical protein